MNVSELIELHEGRRLLPYQDSKGILTIGVGHNLSNGISNEVCDALKQEDIGKAIADVSRELPWYEVLSDARKAAVVDMAFNLGISKLLQFHNTLYHMEHGNWQSAANAMLNSVWAKQVGDKPGQRAYTLAQMVKTGNWPR